MVGSIGERVLRHSLTIADGWNAWYDWFGNDADGFARLNDRITAIAEDIGREPGTIRRSACLLVRVDRHSSERPDPAGGRAVPLDALASVLHDMREAGADEVIVVADPITESSLTMISDALG